MSLPIVPDLGIHKCRSPEDGEPRDDDFCDLYEASEIGAPCQGGCYFEPCEHGLQSGCQVACAACGHPCCWHMTVNSATGELARVCMDDDKPCPKSCKAFAAPAIDQGGEPR